MKKLLTLAAGLAAGLALLVTPAGAITGNYQEDFVHDYVGLIVFYDADGEFMWRCSGSLIAPTVFLTAGHCTDQDAEESPTSARIYFRQDAGAHYDPVTELDPKSGYPETCVNDPAVPDGEEICVTASKLYDYGFDNFAGFPNHRDIGIAILDTPVTTLGFAQLPTVGYVDTLGKKAWITSSGYGVTDWDPRTRFVPRAPDGGLVHRQSAERDHERIRDPVDRESGAGQGRDLQRRLGRPGPPAGHEHHPRGDVVGLERTLQGARLLVPRRPGRRTGLDRFALQLAQ
jgi:hypothetical protein